MHCLQKIYLSKKHIIGTKLFMPDAKEKAIYALVHWRNCSCLRKDCPLNAAKVSVFMGLFESEVNNACGRLNLCKSHLHFPLYFMIKFNIKTSFPISMFKHSLFYWSQNILDHLFSDGHRLAQMYKSSENI